MVDQKSLEGEHLGAGRSQRCSLTDGEEDFNNDSAKSGSGFEGQGNIGSASFPKSGEKGDISSR
jgi:hypothetical protein